MDKIVQISSLIFGVFAVNICANTPTRFENSLTFRSSTHEMSTWSSGTEFCSILCKQILRKFVYNYNFVSVCIQEKDRQFIEHLQLRAVCAKTESSEIKSLVLFEAKIFRKKVLDKKK
jgi:hypothetical protein